MQVKIENKFVNELISDVISKLTGSNKSYDRLVLPNYPQKLLILGSLSEEDPSFIENESTNVKSNSLTVMFLTKEEVKINVKPNFDLFYGIQEEVDDLEKYGLKRDDKIKIPFVWKRLKTNFPEFQLNKDNNKIELDFKDYVKSILEDEEHNLFYEKEKLNLNPREFDNFIHSWKELKRDGEKQKWLLTHTQE